ncbi:MAG: hypothetical protein KJ736_04900, partial [Candidatus Omnitrophica bacterium]|nr:hypothetical protein [Candidatus Omnitrophota bacterium]
SVIFRKVDWRNARNQGKPCADKHQIHRNADNRGINGALIFLNGEGPFVRGPFEIKLLHDFSLRL